MKEGELVERGRSRREGPRAFDCTLVARTRRVVEELRRIIVSHLSRDGRSYESELTPSSRWRSTRRRRDEGRSWSSCWIRRGAGLRTSIARIACGRRRRSWAMEEGRRRLMNNGRPSGNSVGRAELCSCHWVSRVRDWLHGRRWWRRRVGSDVRCGRGEA